MVYEDPQWHTKPAPEDANIEAFLDRWKEWAQAESVPLRSRFDPIDFPRVLPWMVLAEVLSVIPFDARLRYLGSEVVHYLDSAGLTGKRLSDLGRVFQDRWSAVGNLVLSTRRPCFFDGAPFMVDRSFMRLELAALPLSKDGSEVDFIMLLMVPRNR